MFNVKMVRTQRKNLNYGTELHKRHLSHTIVRQINKNMGKGLRKKRQTLLKLIIKRRTFKGILCCYQRKKVIDNIMRLLTF